MILDCETHPFSPGNRFPKVVITATDEGMFQGKPPLSRVTGFEVSYDMGCIAKTFDMWDEVFELYDKGYVRDLRTNEQLKDFAEEGSLCEPYSLVDVALRYDFRHSCKESPWRTRYAELENVPYSEWPLQARQYVEEDVAATKHINERTKFMPDLESQSRWDFGLRLVSGQGLLVDQEATRKLREDCEKEAWSLVPQIPEFFHSSNQTSFYFAPKEFPQLNEKAIRKFVKDQGGKRRTDKGKVQISKEALAEINHPSASLLSKYKEIQSILAREIKLLETSEIVHTRYDLAVSGRTRSRKPNLQNLSKKSGSRRCFKPRPGYALVSLDYPTLELRTLAQACKELLGFEGELLKAFREGKDPHSLFANQYLEGNRLLAKAANFGFAGMLQGDNFARFAKDVYGLVVQNPKSLQHLWFNMWPEMRTYIVKAPRMCTWGKPLEHLVSGRLRGKCSASQACNTFFQGLGADVAKSTLYNLVRESYVGQLRDMKVVGFIHDEFLFEIPISELERYKPSIVEIVKDTWGKYCPDVPVGPLEFEHSYGC